MVNPKGNRSLDYLVFLWRHQDAILWKQIFSNISTMKMLIFVGSWLDDSSKQVINLTDKAHAMRELRA